MNAEQMNMKSLTSAAIQTEAESLLEQYGRHHPPVGSPPIPVEDILENFLGLSLDFDDLQARLGSDDVAAALYVEDRSVFIDESLDPVDHPNREERYREAIAHEIGHWCTHRDLPLVIAQPMATLARARPLPAVNPEPDDIEGRIEWEAGHFASCLLMPRAMVFEAWQEAFGSLEPQTWTQSEVDGLRGLGYDFPDEELAMLVLDGKATDLSELFLVTKPSMRIRLVDIGLFRA